MRQLATLLPSVGLAMAVLVASLLILLPARPPVRAEKAQSVATLTIDPNLLTLEYGYNLTGILPNGL